MKILSLLITIAALSGCQSIPFRASVDGTYHGVTASVGWDGKTVSTDVHLGNYGGGK